MNVDGKKYRTIWLAKDGECVEIIDQTKQVIKGIHNKKKFLEMINLEVLIDHPFQLDGISLDHGRFDAVFDFRKRT